MPTAGEPQMRTHEAIGADARVLSGRVYGPDQGSPVLFVAGAATGASMLFGQHLLEPWQVRLITMDRPGMGRSSLDPQRTVPSTADDYAAFLEDLGIALPVPVVANSQGSVFGLALAAAGYASTLVLASPADEVAHPPITALLPDDLRRLTALAQDDPDSAERWFAGLTPEAMEQFVLAGSPEADRQIYQEPSFAGRYRAALAEGFAHQGQGYARDSLLAMRPWPIDLTAIEIPVIILFGALDTTHSPDLGRTLTERIPTAARRVLAGVGGSLLWTRAEDVLGAAGFGPGTPEKISGDDATDRPNQA